MSFIKLSEETHEILLQADSPNYWQDSKIYSGQDIDYDDAIKRGEMVLIDLELEFRRQMYFAADQQDAYYWEEIYELDQGGDTNLSCVEIRFSFCGNLAATKISVQNIPLCEEKKRKISLILAAHGFVWVDGDVLRQVPYDGRYDYFKNDAYNAPATWWDRFFEYE